MALYRTYRPQTFTDVVGQDAIVTTLEQAATQEKFSHAYLFVGSRGTGKTSVARILAKHLMCRGIADPVLKQSIIKGIEEGSIVDLLEIDAASNTGVDNIRDLIEKIQFSPVVASAKVYIIDEVHMLSKGAFNALLKTLEEPPAYAHFILATTEMHKVPATIQSRCQCFHFLRIGEDDIIRRLQYIADIERITVDREALRLIAHHVEGGMRDAISLLDQLRSVPHITVGEVEQRIGVTGHEHLEEIIRALETGDAPALLEAIQTLEGSGFPLDLFLRSLLARTRDQLHAAIAAGQSITEITHTLDILLAAIRDVRLAPVPGLVLEAALLTLCLPSETSSRKEAPKTPSPRTAEAPPKEKKPKQKDPAPEAPTETPPPAPTEESSLSTAEIEAPDVTMETVRSAWPKIIADASPPSVKMSLKNGEITTIEGETITVSFTSSFHRDKVASPDASRSVEQLLQNKFKRHLKLSCILEKSGDSTKSTVASEDLVNLAEAAAEIF
ncbi:MAG: DNA polymerase III subunit gamma/tau [Candidatus Peregrinibacteria bacterium]